MSCQNDSSGHPKKTQIPGFPRKPQKLWAHTATCHVNWVGTAPSQGWLSRLPVPI